MTIEGVAMDRYRTPTIIVALGLALAAGVGGASEPTSTPTPAATRTPIVITDDNLADYAAQGHLTTADSNTAESKSAERRPVHRSSGDANTRIEDAAADAAGLAADEKRQYWRRRYEQQLELLASIEDQIVILDREIPGLWRDFYAWDDPAYRDGVIKVQLDGALARSERLKQQLGVEREQLTKIRVEARKGGAEPGWFRGLEVPTPLPTPGN
jgi:hypothetical protein